MEFSGLKFKQTVTEGKTMVLVADESTDFSNYGLSAEEITYVKKSIEKEQNLIFFNRYTYYIYVQLPDLKKTGKAALEFMRNAAFKVFEMLKQAKAEEVEVVDASDKAEMALAFVEGMALSNYQFTRYLIDSKDKIYALTTICLVSKRISPAEVQTLSNRIEGVYFARDMVNEPASFLTSTQLSNQIKQAGERAGFAVKILKKADIQELKMGGLLAVNQGSSEPPTFTILEWKPANAINTKPYVLVGKGVVYDSGGLSLKPTADSMDYMKCDMAGAAAVAGTFINLAKSRVPLYVIGLIPSTDNRLDAHSYSPGDVITMYNGTTVEVLNTDAEGRLILADALTYAKQFNPELVITIATLTGAAHRAVGELGIVGMGNASDKEFDNIINSGWDVYERIARFPFWEEYAELLKSDIADLKNIGGELAGAITAGKFLEYFTDYPFIHLDIAGMAFHKKGDKYRGKGATGIGVRLLSEFLSQKSKD